MDVSPPSYAALFPQRSTFSGVAPVASAVSHGVCHVASVGAAASVGTAASGVFPPPCNSGVIQCNPLPTPGETLLGTATGVDSKLQQQMSLLQEQVNSLRRDLIARLPPSQPCIAVVDASTSPPTPPSFSGEDGASEWRRLLLWQQGQIETLNEALRRALSSPTTAAATIPILAKNKGECVENDQEEAGEAEGRVPATNTGNVIATAFRIVSAESQRDASVDLVEILTSFYNLPAAKCWRCHEHLPSTFGEELLAAALGTTSRDLLDRYVSLLVMRLNEGCATVAAKEAHRAAVVLGAKSGEAAEKTLAHLPFPVLRQVLDRTQFPSEIPVYRIAFAACELHHMKGCLSSSRAACVTCSPPTTTVCTSGCHCKEEDAEILLHGVRFLWLPTRFLEDEVQRREGPGLGLEACRCALYTGLLLRLRQAIRLKACLKGASEALRDPLPDACTSEVFLTELRRVRLSYTFLGSTEKMQLLRGEGIDVSQLRQLQGRCDASF